MGLRSSPGLTPLDGPHQLLVFPGLSVYNEHRPQSPLGYQTPMEYAQNHDQRETLGTVNPTLEVVH